MDSLRQDDMQMKLPQLLVTACVNTVGQISGHWRGQFKRGHAMQPPCAVPSCEKHNRPFSFRGEEYG